MSQLKTYNYDGYQISFAFEDSSKMINATMMAKPFKKYPADFLRLKQTKLFIAALEKRYGNPHNENSREILRIIQAGDAKLQGTWMDEKLALKFAAWLNPDFELWVWDRIYELLTTGKTEIMGFETEEQFKKSLAWYLKKITYSVDEVRNLLDTIPGQNPELNRLNYLDDEDKKELGLIK